MNEGKVTPQQVSMAKMPEIATNICRDARQMLGGMGITGEYPVMRHMMNLESVITYERHRYSLTHHRYGCNRHEYI
jgi:glutaryl-CoA dehydrogenase